MYSLSAPLIMKAFGIFMFGAKNISITMETLDVVLCAERMVTSVAFPRLFVRIPFPFVPPSCFFDNAMYNLSAPLTMRAFGILMFRSKKTSPSQWKLWTLSFVPKGWLHLLRFNDCRWNSLSFSSC